MNKIVDRTTEKLLLNIIERSEANLGICVQDNDGNIIWGYNENKVFDTACSIMIFIMLEYYRQLNDKIISGDELIVYEKENYATGSGIIKFLTYGRKIRVKDLVELMIAVSDHIAANMLIDFLKIDNINKTIKSFNFYNTKLHHKFLIPDLKNMGSSTPFELSLFYKLLNENKFYGAEICQEMCKILLKQKYKDILAEKIIEMKEKFYIDIACKSGKADGRIYNTPTDSYIVDSGTIYTKVGEYHIAIMGELNYFSEQSLNIVKSDIQEISKNIYCSIIRR